MSEELGATIETTVAPTEVTGEISGTVESSLIDQARQEGWVPLEEFKGNPDNWADAKEFLRVGKIIKARDDKNSKLERELKELKQITKSMLSNMQKAEKIAYEKAAKDLEIKLLRAKELGDVEEAFDIAKQQHELEVKAQQELQQHNTSFKDSEEFKGFLPENNWVVATDRVSKAMQKVATEMSIEFAKANPNCSWKEELDYIHTEIRKEFPDQFKNEKIAKQSHSSVLGASSIGKDGSNDSINSKLSKDERQVADYLKSKGYDYKAYIKALSK
jgi:hypothetical protein